MIFSTAVRIMSVMLVDLEVLLIRNSGDGHGEPERQPFEEKLPKSVFRVSPNFAVVSPDFVPVSNGRELVFSESIRFWRLWESSPDPRVFQAALGQIIAQLNQLWGLVDAVDIRIRYFVRFVVVVVVTVAAHFNQINSLFGRSNAEKWFD